MCLLISQSLFRKVFGRKTDPPLDEVELVGTHYEKWRDIINGSIARLRGLEWKQLHIKGCGGVKLTAMMYDAGSDKTAVMCHGYRTHYFCNTAVAAGYFLDRGYNVVLIISRGHDGSEGEYITFGELEFKDLLLWLDMLEKKMKMEKIVLYGISLGSNTVMRASEFIKPGAVRAIVADCGFMNTRETLTKQVANRGKNFVTRIIYPLVFVPILYGMRVHGKKNGFDIFSGDTRVSLSKTRIPVFFLHGAKDKVVPLKDSEMNYKACASPKELFISKEAEHGACFADGGADLAAKLDGFLGKYI